MKHHFRFKIGKAEGEANSPLGMVLLTIIAIAFLSVMAFCAYSGGQAALSWLDNVDQS